MHLQVSVHVQPNQKTTMQAHPTVFCPISFPLNVLNVQFVPLCVRTTDTGPYSALFHVCFANPVHPVSGTRSPVTTHSELSSQDRSWQGSFILQRVKSPTRLNYLPLCFQVAVLLWNGCLDCFGRKPWKCSVEGELQKKKPHSNSYSWVRSRGRAHW